jgi:flagellin
LSSTTDSTIITFTGSGTGVQNFTSNTNFINSTGHGLANGDRVVYSVAAGDTVIPGLTNGLSYIVRNRTANSFQLSSTTDATIITLGSGDGSFSSELVTISTALLTDAIAINSRNRAELGSRLNVLSYAIDNLETLSNNLGEAYSRIVDTDYAAETANLTRNQILQQAAAAMLAQANQAPNVILSLLQPPSSEDTSSS